MRSARRALILALSAGVCVHFSVLGAVTVAQISRGRRVVDVARPAWNVSRRVPAPTKRPTATPRPLHRTQRPRAAPPDPPESPAQMLAGELWLSRAQREWELAGRPSADPEVSSPPFMRGLPFTAAELWLVSFCTSVGVRHRGRVDLASGQSTFTDRNRTAVSDPRGLCPTSCCLEHRYGGWCYWCTPVCKHGDGRSCTAVRQGKTLHVIGSHRLRVSDGLNSTLPTGQFPVDFGDCAREAGCVGSYVAGQAQRKGEFTTRFSGRADEKLRGLDRSGDGVIAVLYSSDAFVWRMLRSICRYFDATHPLVFFWTDFAPSDAIQNGITATVSGADCRVRRQVWFVEVPPKIWDIAQSANPDNEPVVSSGGTMRTGVLHSEGYRKMCWFWHYSIHSLECLSDVEFVMRLDTDSEFLSAPLADPFTAVRRSGASYGYASFCYDNTAYTRGLWHQVARYAERSNLSFSWPGFCVPEPTNCVTVKRTAEPHSGKVLTVQSTSMQLDMMRSEVSSNGPLAEYLLRVLLDACPVPMFYTNFEVLRRSFFRRPDVRLWLESVSSGIEKFRWGDAPLRALTLGMFGSPSDVLHLNDFGYRHGRDIDPVDLKPGQNLSVDWVGRRWPQTDDDTYWLGVCLRPPDPSPPPHNVHCWNGHLPKANQSAQTAFSTLLAQQQRQQQQNGVMR